MTELPVVILFGAFGAVFVIIGISGAGWYFRSVMQRPFWRRLGKTGSRIFTVLIGLLFLLYAAAVKFSWI